MADLAMDFERGEDVLILALIVAIGYGLYKFSTSANCFINQLFGLQCSTPANDNPATAPAGYSGTYASAANTVVTDPITSLETILGLNQSMPPAPATVGSVVIPPQSTPSGGSAF